MVQIRERVWGMERTFFSRDGFFHFMFAIRQMGCAPVEFGRERILLQGVRSKPSRVEYLFEGSTEDMEQLLTLVEWWCLANHLGWDPEASVEIKESLLLR